MPYSAEHKRATRARIIEAARALFNRHGFEGVSIDMVMEAVGLTRGGFYNHFPTKDTLYLAAVTDFLRGRGAQWHRDAGVTDAPSGEAAKRLVTSYLSNQHLHDLDGQCPMIALPSDVARAGPELRSAYQHLLQAMVDLLQSDLDPDTPNPRERALAMAALCIGGMVAARAMPDDACAHEVRNAALNTVTQLGGWQSQPAGANAR